MKLKDYMDKYRLTPIDLALKFKISIASTYRYLQGAKMRRDTAKAIEEKTDKEVTFEELMGYENGSNG